MNKIIRQVVFYFIIVIIWFGVSWFGWVSESSLPSPVNVFKWIVINFKALTFWKSVGLSMERIFTGYTIALGLGMATGILMSQSRFLSETLGPLIMSLQTVPNICWVPMLLLWFGPTESAIITNIILGSFLSIAIGTDSGFKNVPMNYINAARNMGAAGLNLALHVRLPAALPTIISGMKQGWAFAWRGLISAEMLFATFGLGNLLMQGKDKKDMIQVIALMIVIILLGWLVNQVIFNRLENWIRGKWGLEKQ